MKSLRFKNNPTCDGEESKVEARHRTAAVKTQIIYSVLIKFVSVFIGLLLVPLMIESLTVQRYAVWLTLSSIFSWFSFFDLGLGNGLRNKLTESLANGERRLAQQYVSTTYALVTLIFVALIGFFLLVNPMLDWPAILNANEVGKEELYVLTSIVFTLFLLRFIFHLVGVVYIALQRPAINNALITAGNLLAFSAIIFAYRFSDGSLLLYSILLVGVPLVVLIIWTIFAFKGEYSYLRPRLRLVNMEHARSLLNLGGVFLIVQVGAIVLFASANIIISQMFGPEEVVVYSSALTYYQLPVVAYGIIMSPIWSAVTDAYTRGDREWLLTTLRKLNLLSILFIIGILLMTWVSPMVYRLWLGPKIDIPFSVTIAMALFAIINVVLAPYSSFINGIGKIRLSALVVGFSIIAYFPIAYLFGDWLGGSAGIMFATCMINGLGLYFQPRQVYKLLSGRASGIWAK